MTKNWEDNLRRKMENYEEQAPKGLLNDVMSEMAGRRHRRFAYYGGMFAAAAIAALLLLNVLTNKTEIPNEYQTAESIMDDAPSAVKQDGKLIAVAKEVLMSSAISTKANDKPANAEIAEVADVAGIAVEKTDAEKQEPAHENKNQSEVKNEANDAKKESYRYPSASVHSSRHDNHLQISIGFMGNVLGSAQSSTNNNMILLSDAAPIGPHESNLSNGSVRNVVSSHTSTKAHHRQPVRIGLNVAVPITDKWSIESGLFYSFHRSDITKNIGAVVTESEQSLHYLGVPLTATYKIWNNKSLSVYAGLGGAVEKLVSGQQKSNDTGESQKVEEGKLQWSANAKAGVEYKLAEKVGIYAEPGVGYYFDNNSMVKSVYADRPFSFELKLGLRFSTK